MYGFFEDYIQLPKEDPYLFANLYNLLEEITIPYKQNVCNNNRRGFPKHRATVFGLTKGRFSGKTDLSNYSKKYPEIYNEIKMIGDKICNHSYTSIYVNHNVICPKHKDSENVGISTLVSFGDYKGCKLVIENEKFETDCHPVIFNGCENEHWNTDDLIGNKYSLVFYNMKKNPEGPFL